MNTNQSRTLKTVENTLDLIEALEEMNGAGVTELADYLDLSKGGVYNHLATLHQHGYVLKDGDKYKLSFRFFNLGHFVKHRTDLYNIAKPEVDRLAKETGGHAVLLIEEFGKAVYLYRAIGQRGVSEEFTARRLESTDYLHVSSVGKSILAYLPLRRLEEIVEEYGLPAKTDHTITTVDELLEERVTIQDRGYSICDEEAVPGIRAVGAPIIRDGEVLGAISVSGPKSQIDIPHIHGEISDIVKEAANVIEINLETKNSSKIVRY